MNKAKWIAIAVLLGVDPDYGQDTTWVGEVKSNRVG